MLNTFAFSTERILECVYAFACVDAITRKTDRPAVLGRDQEPALRRILRNCASRLFVCLSPPVVSTSLAGSPDDDLITVEFDIPDIPGRDLIRPAVESILAAMTAAVA